MIKTHRCHIRAILVCLMLFPGFAINLQAQSEREIVILGTGDTMMGSWASQVIADSGVTYPFENLRNTVSGADVFFTNLEAPFGTAGTAFEKKFTFRVKPSLVQVLLDGGVNLVSLANNHIMDFGSICLDQTIETLQNNAIYYAGAGKNLKQARKPAIIEAKGKRIGFLAYSLTFPEEFWASDTSAGTCFPFEEFAFNDVRALKQQCDFVIISCHWGQELMETPKKYQVKLAHRLIDNGADLILGHHPHIVQGIEQYKDKWIAYSLGNFIFGSYSESARDSFIFKITVNEAFETTAQVIPINVYNKDVNFRPVILDGENRDAFFLKLKNLSVELNSGTFGITNEGMISINNS